MKIKLIRVALTASHIAFLATIAYLIFYTSSVSAQSPGQVVQAATPAVNRLDPNGDGWITRSGSAFQLLDDSTESEIPYAPVQLLMPEPTGDLHSGPTCGVTEITDLPFTPNRSVFVYYDTQDGTMDNGNDLLLFRIRAARKRTSGSFGYSVLLDTDGRIGNNDPNSVPGNPGFEIEIRIKTGGGSGLFVDNVDGRTSGVNVASYNLSTNYQHAVAKDNDPSCSGQAAFHDLVVSTSDLGISSASAIRIFAATSQSGNSVLGGSSADWAGIDDTQFPNPDVAITTFGPSLPPVVVSTLGPGGGGWLAVTLSSFEAIPGNGVVNLRWKTIQESQNAAFLVQRSLDGVTFSKIGQVAGAGDSQGLQSYAWDDTDPHSGDAWYRLAMVDRAGEATFSEVLKATLAPDPEVKVSFGPNPTAQFLNVLLEPAAAQVLQGRLTDINGQVLITFEIPQGETAFQLDLGDRPAGMYIIKVRDGANIRWARVVKE